MQTRGIEVSQLYTLVRDTTDLTGVQAKILDHMQVALQCASDISKSQVYLCARGKNEDISVILTAVKPSYTHGSTFFHAGDTFLVDDLAIVDNVFQTGRKVVGRNRRHSISDRRQCRAAFRRRLFCFCVPVPAAGADRHGQSGSAGPLRRQGLLQHSATGRRHHPRCCRTHHVCE